MAPHNNFSAASNLQTDRVPLRKQLKQDAKSLKAQKKQRKANEEASRKEWELTVGVEIHAQLNTAAKLFSSMSIESLLLASLTRDISLNRSSHIFQRYPEL